LIIDSGSHAWAGEGGLLEQKGTLDSKPGSNHFTNWAPITKSNNQFNNSFLHSTCHIIMTLRSKTEVALVDAGNGKTKPQKMGLAPIAREGLEYEFSAVLDIDINHNATSSKDRTKLFDGKTFQVSEQTGIDLKKWLDSGVEPTPVIKFDLSPEIAKLASASIPKGDHVATLGSLKGKKLSDISGKELFDFVLKMRQNNLVKDSNFREVELIEAYVDEIGYVPPTLPPMSYKDDTLD